MGGWGEGVPLAAQHILAVSLRRLRIPEFENRFALFGVFFICTHSANVPLAAVYITQGK